MTTQQEQTLLIHIMALKYNSPLKGTMAFAMKIDFSLKVKMYNELGEFQ